MLLQRNLGRVGCAHGWASHLTQRSRAFTSSIPRPQEQDATQPPQERFKRADDSSYKKHLIDRMASTPSFRLNSLIKDIIPTTKGRNDVEDVNKPTPRKHYLSLYDHLAYWPLEAAPSQLAPDGADADHVPPGRTVAAAHEDPSLGLRLWESGHIQYKRNWRLDFLFDGKLRLCVERATFGAKEPPRTQISRTYSRPQRDTQISIREQRRLLFVKGPLAKRIMTERPGDQEPQRAAPTDADFMHEFTTTPAQLFQFSALTFNSHYIHLDSQNGIVHGPLSYALMLRVVEQHLEMEKKQYVREFMYDLRKPLKVGQKAFVCLSKTSLPEGIDPSETVRRMHDDEEAKPQERWRVWISRDDGMLIAEGMVVTEAAGRSRPNSPAEESEDFGAVIQG